MDQQAFQCSCCGETLNGPPFAWHFDAPDAWSLLPPEDRASRGELSSDQCVIANQHFFIRGLVEIRIHNSYAPFAWGVWVSLSEANFAQTQDLWQNSERAQEPAYFGWLCNSIPGYPETLHLKTMVHSRGVGALPYIELEATQHPLALEQQRGITMERVRKIAEQRHHRWPAK